MQNLSTIIATLLAAASAVSAAPSISARAVSAMADVPQWTIASFTRTCDPADTSCLVTFAVNNGVGEKTPCAYTVTGSPASRTSTNGIRCGPYTLSSNWSDQFGPGFTTWAFVREDQRLITWPAYADWELVNGKAVVPDKSYAPQNLA